jgi:hypothetical protein
VARRLPNPGHLYNTFPRWAARKSGFGVWEARGGLVPTLVGRGGGCGARGARLWGLLGGHRSWARRAWREIWRAEVL